MCVYTFIFYTENSKFVSHTNLEKGKGEGRIRVLVEPSTMYIPSRS